LSACDVYPTLETSVGFQEHYTALSGVTRAEVKEMSVQQWTATLTESVARVASALYDYLPTIVASFALLIIGWVVAALLRWLTLHLARQAIGRLALTRPLQIRLQQSQSFRSFPAVASRLVFWGVLLFFLAVAVEALQLQVVSSVMNTFTGYLPRVLLGIVIVFGGLWAGELVRTSLARAAAKAGIAQGEAIGRVAQWLVVFVAIIIGVDQIGINSTVLITTLVTVFGATLGAVALAFGLGARGAVSNIIAAHYVRKAYRVGDAVRIADQEGRVAEITQTAVVLETDQGRVMVPTRQFSEQVSILLRREN
jgi:small-conductance mechanosensitive channel